MTIAEQTMVNTIGTLTAIGNRYAKKIEAIDNAIDVIYDEYKNCCDDKYMLTDQDNGVTGLEKIENVFSNP